MPWQHVTNLLDSPRLALLLGSIERRSLTVRLGPRHAFSYTTRDAVCSSHRAPYEPRHISSDPQSETSNVRSLRLTVSTSQQRVLLASVAANDAASCLKDIS